MVALLVASAAIMFSLVKWAREAQEPTMNVAQPPSTAPIRPAAIPPSEPVPRPAPNQPQPLSGADDKGFVNTNARCDGQQTAVALGRTERSYVVICGDTEGHYEYLGVRLSDEAMLRTAAETMSSQRFLARNADTTYAVSPNELLISSGDTVIKQEPMLEFRGPR
jgi:hypothetical protein